MAIFFIAILLLAGPLSPVDAAAAAEQARRAIDSVVKLLSVNPSKHSPAAKAQVFESPSQRADRVKHLRLCPRRLLLYVGESFTLVPLPLDQNNDAVHGAALTFEAKDLGLATVSSWGEVSAIAPGQTQVTVQAGTTKAHVNVEVRAGVRPRPADRKQADLDWDAEHGHDCDDPEAAQLIEPRLNLVAEGSPARPAEAGIQVDHSDVGSTGDQGRAAVARSLKQLARPAMVHRSRSEGRGAIAVTNASVSAPGKIFARGFFQAGAILDGDGTDPISPAAAAPYNAVGSTRFGAVEQSQGSAAKTKNNLGSYDYVFSAPVLGLPGRGIDVNLALALNSRVWSKETAGMTFNYGKGWPAPGWTLGYGRLIDNYDGLGNWLLIQPDGTRTHLQLQPAGSLASTDGSFITMGVGTGGALNGKLRYPDGTLVTYSSTQNFRWLPVSIRSRNGDMITIAYKQYNKIAGDPLYFPYRWAIDHITDTLGRIITFHYYGDAGYPEDTTGAKPKYALAAITAPDQGNGSVPRTMVQIDYQTITLEYNFSLQVDPNNNPSSGSQITVLKRIYYPATGRGFLFQDYSTYGMARRISVCNNMTGANGAITDGTPIAYTKYNYTTMDPSDPYNRNQVGLLNDSPQYTIRSEWWQGKTDDTGAPTTATTDYTYSRSTVTDPLLGSVEIDKVSYPNGMDMVTTSGNDQAASPESFGHVLKTEIKSGATSLRTTQPSYVTDSSGGQQISQVMATDEAGNTAKTTYDYGSYGRVANVNEYGFSATIQRTTTFKYADTLVDANLLQVVKQIDVFDGSGTNVARTAFTLDDYAAKGGMQTYAIMPPGQTHDSSFDQNNTTRGNVTGVTTWVKFGATAADDIKITRNSKVDVFGNVVQADVSCCQVKNINYLDGSGNPFTYYSQPMSVTDGTPDTAPFLTTSYQYDFNTGLLNSTTDPNGLTTTFVYDSAWRMKTVNSPSGSVTTTQFDRDANGNDQLAYLQQVTYKEKDTDPDSAKKTITSKSWFDGAGRVLRSGSGAGSTPASFDTVAAVYDSMGRVLKQSNPYSGDLSGNAGTGVTLYWTQNTYDSLSRVTTVTLPDSQTVRTEYNGATVTVTDQVGRKRQSQVDGLGRLISVTEMNPDTGLLDATNYLTSYSYDTLNNLTGVNQGGQTRSFAYDALGRMTSQTTPEGGAVSFTYTDFGAVLKRTDARTVETHYKYDSLNRLDQVWYTGPNGSDDPGASRPPLPAGVAPTFDVTLTYNNFTTPQPCNGQVSTITDGAGSESYAYDTLARVASKTRVIDTRGYQTQYQYNQLNQLALMIYPSGKRIRMNHDSRGRLSGEDTVDAANNVLTSYLSSIGYNEAGQVTGLSLGNGVNETYGYSADRLQLTSQTATSFAGSLINLKYIYQTVINDSGVGTTANNSGQLMMISGTIGPKSRTERFTYDDLGRLATAYGKGLWGRRYEYDRWGNRTAVYDAISGGNQIQNVALEQFGGVPTNRIASVGGVNYDASGNLTSDGVHNYQYDTESRMVSVDSGSTATSSYDSANRRVKKIAGGVTTHYVWEGSQVIAEYNGTTGALISEYVFAGSRMLAREQGGALMYFLQDRLSTRVVTNSSGNLVGREDHLPFGEDAGTGSGETEKHRFTTYERDSESGTDYAINRQYATNTGRFTRPDPVGGLFFAPQSFNRYAYSMNDPINLSDPLGLYEPCVHQAMTEYLARQAGLAAATAAKLGEFAGNAPGGADSGEFAVNFPKSHYSEEQWAIHYPTDEQLARFESTFWGEVKRGRTPDLISAGHTLHAIEDGHGAHKDYINNSWGHGFASARALLGLGDDPDAVIGDPTFLSVANEVYQFLTKNPNARLTDKQIEELMTAVLRKCRDAGKKLKVSPFYHRPGGSFFGFGGGVPSWFYSLQEFLDWLDSIPVGFKDEKDHLA